MPEWNDAKHRDRTETVAMYVGHLSVQPCGRCKGDCSSMACGDALMV